MLKRFAFAASWVPYACYAGMVYANRMACFGRGAPSLWQPLLSPSVWKDKLSDALGPPTAMLAYEKLPGNRLLHGVGYSLLSELQCLASETLIAY